MGGSNPESGGSGREKIAVAPVGIRNNLRQFLWLVSATIMVGGVVGTERAVVPLMALRLYHVGPALAFTFIGSFGAAKALFNLVAGRWSDRVGRRRVLTMGWFVGVPMMALLLLVHAWWAIVAANVLLGINQALTWTMTVTSQMDLAGPRERGLAMGINEATGYIGVALSTVAGAALAARWGLKLAPFLLMTVLVVAGLLQALLVIRETRAQALADVRPGVSSPSHPSAWSIFWDTTIRHPALSTSVLGGFVNKLADTMAWGGLPLFFAAQGLSVTTIGVLSGVYAITWGLAQFGTGVLSDYWGRKPPIVTGLAVLGVGLTAMPHAHTVIFWGLLAALMGLGMALLYPNLNAAVGDVAPIESRGSVLGVYRLWRDGGYAVGGLVSGSLFLHWGASATIQGIGGLVLLTAVVTAIRLPETHKPRAHLT